MCLGAAGIASGQAGGDILGRSTLDARVLGTGAEGPFRSLGDAPGEPFVTREAIAKAQPGREGRRRSLLYFGQLTDMHIIDEESPARVEFLDPAPSPAPFSSAWRPWEALQPHTVDRAIAQMNSFVDASTVADGAGARAKMEFTVTTGDSADNQQRNETELVVGLLEGGTVDPNSGVADASTYDPVCKSAVTATTLDPTDAPRYTGVQDYDDYVEGADPPFYDPDDPRGSTFATWPKHARLMDRAQEPFEAEGLDVPSYVTFGNHDGLVQGNEDATAPLETVATGCLKVFGQVGNPANIGEALAGLTPGAISGLLTSDPTKVGFVPPDPERQFVSKPQYKALHATGKSANAHGFGLVDPEEASASNGAAGYYSWSPKPGFRFIALDTVSEGGVAGPSAAGNVDDPQFQWLEGELEEATARNELIFLYSHHAIASLEANVPDEAAAPCTDPTAVPPPDGDGPSHDVNPGCDLDPRSSSPIHLGSDLEELALRFPHVIAWVAGHSHVNSVEAFKGEDGRGFWSIRTAAEVDWPQQNRLIDVMDNRDGTLSIFDTILDHASAVAAPAPDPAPVTRSAGAAGKAGAAKKGPLANAAAVADFGTAELASLSRTFAYNDPQSGGTPAFGEPNGEGEPIDRNVELLVGDPRAQAAAAPAPTSSPGSGSGSGDDSGSSGGGDDTGASRATVTADDTGSLPFTGLELLALVVLGLALTATGLVTRRRLAAPRGRGRS